MPQRSSPPTKQPSHPKDHQRSTAARGAVELLCSVYSGEARVVYAVNRQSGSGAEGAGAPLTGRTAMFYSWSPVSIASVVDGRSRVATVSRCSQLSTARRQTDGFRPPPPADAPADKLLCGSGRERSGSGCGAESANSQ